MLDRQLEEYMGPDAMKAGVAVGSQTLCWLFHSVYLDHLKIPELSQGA